MYISLGYHVVEPVLHTMLTGLLAQNLRGDVGQSHPWISWENKYYIALEDKHGEGIEPSLIPRYWILTNSVSGASGLFSFTMTLCGRSLVRPAEMYLSSRQSSSFTRVPSSTPWNWTAPESLSSSTITRANLLNNLVWRGGS